jgi:hypothetical protein
MINTRPGAGDAAGLTSSAIGASGLDASAFGASGFGDPWSGAIAGDWSTLVAIATAEASCDASEGKGTVEPAPTEPPSPWVSSACCSLTLQISSTL